MDEIVTRLNQTQKDKIMKYILIGIDEPNKDDCCVLTVTEPLALIENMQGVAIGVSTPTRFVETMVRFSALNFLLDAASEASRLDPGSSKAIPPLPMGEGPPPTLSEQMGRHAAEARQGPMTTQDDKPVE